jgi:hypothetical protein
MRKFTHFLYGIARYGLLFIIFFNQSITFSQINNNQHSSFGNTGINHVKGKCRDARAITGFYFQARKIGKARFVLSRQYRSSGITSKCLCWNGPPKSMSNVSLFSLDTNQMIIVRDSIMFFKGGDTPALVGIKHGNAMTPDTLAITKKTFKLIDLQKVWHDSIPKINSDW